MENKECKKEEVKLLSENQYDKNPPVEFIDHSQTSKEISSEEGVKNEELEKFKRGELGASYIGYNDDGSPHGASRKFDLETETDSE